MYFYYQLKSFTNSRDGYFDISAQKAIDAIKADKSKTESNKREDSEFITRLRNNQPVRFGKRDKKYQKRKFLRQKHTVKKPQSEYDSSNKVSFYFICN